MRKWLIDFFMNDPQEVSEGQELAFYVIMGFPLFAAIGFILILI